MRSWRFNGILTLAGALCAFGAAPLFATPVNVVTDNFTDGTFQDSTGPKAAWFKTVTPSDTLGVADDSAGLGSGNALNYVTGTAFSSIIGVFDTDPANGFDAVTLAATGDKITLSFKFRVTTAGIATANQDLSVRYGLLGNNGTQVTSAADAIGTIGNDEIGYGVRLAIGANTASDIFKDSATAPALGGTGLSSLGTITGQIADNNPHTAVMTLTKTAAGVDITSQLDGGTIFTKSDTTGLVTTFHEVAFLSGNGTPDYRIDDVVVTVDAVPEPAALGLIGCAASCFLSRRRRK